MKAVDRDVACRTAAVVSESCSTVDSRTVVGLVPVNKVHHSLDAALYQMNVKLTPDAVSREDISGSGVFPGRNYDRDVLLAGCKNPAVLWIYLIVLFQDTAADYLVHKLVREKPLSLCC